MQGSKKGPLPRMDSIVVTGKGKSSRAYRKKTQYMPRPTPATTPPGSSTAHKAPRYPVVMASPAQPRISSFLLS